MENLKVDREFEMLIPALTVDEYEQLKSNILSEGEIFNPNKTKTRFTCCNRTLFSTISENIYIQIHLHSYYSFLTI